MSAALLYLQGTTKIRWPKRRLIHDIVIHTCRKKREVHTHDMYDDGTSRLLHAIVVDSAELFQQLKQNAADIVDHLTVCKICLSEWDGLTAVRERLVKEYKLALSFKEEAGAVYRSSKSTRWKTQILSDSCRPK
jgi:hypothetical protein